MTAEKKVGIVDIVLEGLLAESVEGLCWFGHNTDMAFARKSTPGFVAGKNMRKFVGAVPLLLKPCKRSEQVLV